MNERLPIREIGAFHANETPKVIPPPKRFRVVLEGGPRFQIIDLRGLLKEIGRRHGMRCVDMSEIDAGVEIAAPARIPPRPAGGGRGVA